MINEESQKTNITAAGDKDDTKLRLMDEVRGIRTRHYRLRSKQAYTRWIRRYLDFHGKRHPGKWGR